MELEYPKFRNLQIWHYKFWGNWAWDKPSRNTYWLLIENKIIYNILFKNIIFKLKIYIFP